jgi:hypothetical protein
MRRLWPALDHSATGKKKIVRCCIRFVVTAARVLPCVKASLLTELTVLLNFMNMLYVSSEYRVCVFVAYEICGQVCVKHRAMNIVNRCVGGECPEVPGMSR